MNWLRIAATAVAVATLAPTASAQVFSIASNPQGSVFYSIASGIAKVASDKANMQLRVAPYAGGSTYVPLVDRGEMEFAMINAGELTYAYLGQELFEGRKYENLRFVGALMPSASGFGVPVDSDIKTLTDLKGKRLASEYTGGRIFHFLAEATLASAGVSHKDAKLTPAPNFVNAVDLFIAGRIDAAYIPLNSAAGQKAMGNIKGGWRYLPVSGDAAAAERMSKAYPNARPLPVRPGKDALGVTGPMHLLAVDFLLAASKDVPDQVVYDILKVVHASKKDLEVVHPVFNDFDPKNMRMQHVAPIHPGADRFYREVDQ
ncbi:MAG: TAXI family TRAP transporter solute-binding subunit [Alphaproteobacteria bacterium]|nr:TAXI family TRAP transporter solute-binding subunit [Alphaproteobacteria bacterium]